MSKVLCVGGEDNAKGLIGKTSIPNDKVRGLGSKKVEPLLVNKTKVTQQ